MDKRKKDDTFLLKKAQEKENIIRTVLTENVHQVCKNI